MLGSDGNIIAAGDVEGIMVLTDGEVSAVVVTDDGSPLAILPEGTVILGEAASSRLIVKGGHCNGTRYLVKHIGE